MHPKPWGGACVLCSHLQDFFDFLKLYNELIGKASKKKIKKYGIFHTLVGWVGLKKSFSIKIKNNHGLKMPKIA